MRQRLEKLRVMFANVSNTSFLLSAQVSPLTGTASCFLYSSSFVIFASFSVTNIVALLPFCLCVWFLGLQGRCWQKPTSHLDIFTYHMVTMEMVGVLASMVYLYGFFQNVVLILFKALQVYSSTSYGQVYFHILSCLDRYVAVVHPISYIRLKERGGTRLRNILIGCVWFLFILKFFVKTNIDEELLLFYLAFSIVVVLLCNFAVLYVLLRPPPGERVQVSQSKRRAFNTIVLILSALLFRIVLHLSVVGLYNSKVFSEKTRCAALFSGVFFGLPSSVILPLLFLYRSKIMCCNKRSESPVTATIS